MHQYGLIHRDIKAENIVFKDTATQAAAKGVPPIVKFIDLGMATFYKKDNPTLGRHSGSAAHFLHVTLLLFVTTTQVDDTAYHFQSQGNFSVFQVF